MIGRIPVLDVRPQVSCGRWPSRAVVGEPLTFSATAFREGHDLIGVGLALRGPDGKKRPLITMQLTASGTDRWGTVASLDTPGVWSFVVEAWADPVGTWQHDVAIKHQAAQPIALELEEGALLLEEALPGVPKSRRDPIVAAISALRAKEDEEGERLRAALQPDVTALLDEFPLRRLVTPSERLQVRVDRERALYGSWYEFFPRSEGASLDPPKSGTFQTAMARLPAIADMGFDVVYLPPVHPIGHAFRKGPNNTLVANPGDPGSPWAIGSEAGGHDAIHPDLGTFEDFDAFVARVGELGMEVALDLALQCSPDHPWVTKHPEWFTTRADGSIAYAENPPKKYQDIYPLNFDNDPAGIYAEVLRIVRLWLSHGVRIFRVDNPHTKPLAFWEWLLAEVHKTDPDAIFLAEAFTRPPMMQTLAKVGFHQSYTYFTWRNEKWDLEDYLRELAHTDVADYMRPNFFVNTPDILHAYLQRGGPPAFAIRAVLAAMLSPTWGVYSGYELAERTPLRDDSEEYLDTEKFQYRPRDWSLPSLAPYLRRLNEIRRAHPALHWLRNLRFHQADDDAIIAFSKRDPRSGDTVLVVVNMDPHNTRQTVVHVNMPALGLDWGETFECHDEIDDSTYTWRARDNYVRLDPLHHPAHVFAVRRG